MSNDSAIRELYFVIGFKPNLKMFIFSFSTKKRLSTQYCLFFSVFFCCSIKNFICVFSYIFLRGNLNNNNLFHLVRMRYCFYTNVILKFVREVDPQYNKQFSSERLKCIVHDFIRFYPFFLCVQKRIRFFKTKKNT